MTTGLVYSPVYLEHDTGTHVENAGRLTAVMARLEESGTVKRLRLLEPRAATIDEVSLVHTRDYIAQVEAKARSGGAWLDGDTLVSPASYEVALKAVGGTLAAIDVVLDGHVSNAFALVRPPGHHATPGRGMGFCLFNNVAVAAKYAMRVRGLKRIAILDFDVHHGNGTQEAFDDEPRVLYCSTHQMPLYPGTGYMEDNGLGQAKGTKVNVPLPPGSGDDEFISIYREVMAPVVKRFRPDLILVSAGYDPHWAERLASMQMTVTGFAAITRIIKELADALCLGRLVFSLEGGYDYKALSYSVAATLDVLGGTGTVVDPLGFEPRSDGPKGLAQYVKQVREFNGLE